MNFPEEIITLLEGAGLINVYNGIEPQSPDDHVFIQVFGGTGLEATHDGALYESPRVHIIVRARSFNDAWSRALIARNAMIRANFAIEGTRYLRLFPVDSLTDLGEDDNRRRQVGFNVQVVKEA